MVEQAKRERISAMAPDATKTGFSRAAVEDLSHLKAEPKWLRERRLAAWDAYERIPWPTNRDEEWRRTDLRPLKLEAILALDSDGALGTKPGLRIGDLATDVQRLTAGGSGGRAGQIVQVESSAAVVELDPTLAARGIVFCDLDRAVREHPDLVAGLLMTECARPDSDKFAALHAALWSGGFFLYVPRGVRVDLPLRGLVWGERPHLGLFPHTLLVAEPESEVTFVEEHASLGGDGQAFASGVAEIIARPGARVRYVGLQQWGRNMWSFVTQRAVVERDATVSSLVIGFGGRLSKSRVQTALVGPGASAEMLGVVFGDGRQHFDYHTLQDHVAPRTTSELLYKSALKDNARSVFSGLIRAHRSAQKTDAVQTNRNLLLSDNARADSIPELEIEANDLRCTHAAAVAPVDADQIFYLRSRGLTETSAKRLIVEGFFEPILERVPLEDVRERLRTTIGQKIEQRSE